MRCTGKEWKDGRGLKKHYLERRQHSAKELLNAKVKMWLFKGISFEDKMELRDWLEEKGKIVEEGAARSSDEDYTEE